MIHSSIKLIIPDLLFTVILVLKIKRFIIRIYQFYCSCSGPWLVGKTRGGFLTRGGAIKMCYYYYYYYYYLWVSSLSDMQPVFSGLTNETAPNGVISTKLLNAVQLITGLIPAKLLKVVWLSIIGIYSSIRTLISVQWGITCGWVGGGGWGRRCFPSTEAFHHHQFRDLWKIPSHTMHGWCGYRGWAVTRTNPQFLLNPKTNFQHFGNQKKLPVDKREVQQPPTVNLSINLTIN